MDYDLIDITGYAESYEELCNKEAEEGSFYNVLDGNPFTTYRKTAGREFNSIQEKTDVLGWYQNTAELHSYVKKPNDQDVYITGMIAPYTRWKATVRGVDISWAEDGTEDRKIVKNYKTEIGLRRARNSMDDDEIFYSVGEQAPFEIYGVTAEWEPQGAYISRTGKSVHEFANTGLLPGMVAFCHGIFYLYTDNGWRELEIREPIENAKKHTYILGNNKYKIREGFKLGTLEFYSPRE